MSKDLMPNYVTCAGDSDEIPDAPPLRPRRADARRNVERVLRAAEEVFAVEGLSVPIDAVAVRAGVGVGTVYRHFPTKEALFEAVVVARLERLLERAKQLTTASDPGAALFTYVAELVELAGQKKDLTDEMARAGMDEAHVLCAIKAELERSFGVLMHRAQAAGAVRDDISPSEVTALLMGTCLAAEIRGARASTGLMVEVICDGLRSAPSQ